MRIWSPLGGIPLTVTWPENQIFSVITSGSCLLYPSVLRGSPYKVPYLITYQVGRNVVFTHSMSYRGIPSDVADCLVRPCPPNTDMSISGMSLDNNPT
jgi:hypothetical protein